MSIHWWVRKLDRDTSITWNIIWPEKGMKCWNMLQQGHTLKTLCCGEAARHKSPRVVWVPFTGNVQHRQSHREREWIRGRQDTESGDGRKAELGEVIHGYRVSFWGDENVLELVVTVAQNCEYTKTCSTVHFEVSKRVSVYGNFGCLTWTHVTAVSALSSHAFLPCVPSSCKDTSHWTGATPIPVTSFWSTQLQPD